MAEVDAADWSVTLPDGRLALRGGWSPSSGLHHFPLNPVCPYTGADDVEAVPLFGRARLWAWTAVTAAPPGYQGPVPYGFGVVEGRPEGGTDGRTSDTGGGAGGGVLRVVTRLTEPDPTRLAFGQEMELVADTLGDVTVWAFAPVGDASRHENGATP